MFLPPEIPSLLPVFFLVIFSSWICNPAVLCFHLFYRKLIFVVVGFFCCSSSLFCFVFVFLVFCVCLLFFVCFFLMYLLSGIPLAQREFLTGYIFRSSGFFFCKVIEWLGRELVGRELVPTPYCGQGYHPVDQLHRAPFNLTLNTAVLIELH